MANHTNPTTSSTYVDFLSQLMARIDDVARWLNPSDTTPTNLPTGSHRINGTSLQRWGGAAWDTVARLLPATAGRVTAETSRDSGLWDGAQFEARIAVGSKYKLSSVAFHVPEANNAPQVGFSADSGRIGFYNALGNPLFVLPVSGLSNGFVKSNNGVLSSSTVTNWALTLLDDADSSAALTTLGFTAYTKTLINDANAAEARATLGAAGTGAQQFLGRVTADTLRSSMAWQQSQIQAYCQSGSDSDFASISLHVQDAFASPQVGFSAASGGRIGFFSTDGYEIFTVPLAQLANGLTRIVDGVVGSIDKAAALDFLGQSSAINSFSPIVSDANSAVLNGWYTLPPGGSNTPDTTKWWLVSVVAHNGMWCTQYAHAFTTDSPQTPTRRYRELNNGVWTQWVSDDIPIGAAPLASPEFTGTPKSPTPTIGDNSTRLATTAFIAETFAGSGGGNGYRKLSGGTILQWGSSSDSTVAFPIAFPAQCTCVNFSPIQGDSNPAFLNLTASPLTSGFSVNKTIFRRDLNVVQNSPGLTFHWFAIGY